MSDGPRLLAEYLAARGLTHTDFARRCGVGPSAVVRWLDGSRVPRREMRKEIERLTSGKVSRFWWLTPEEVVLEKAREEWLAVTADPPLQIQRARNLRWSQRPRRRAILR